MSIRIINYNDITNLKNHKEYDFLKNTLHICATADMTKGMYKKYGSDFNKPIISIGDVSRYISGSWEDSLEKLAQYTIITKCIKELEECIKNDDYKKLIKATKRNKLDILDSIRNLVECDVDIDSFLCKTKEEKIFIDIWKKFDSYYENNINDFKDIFFSYNSDNEKFYNRFKDAVIKSIEVQEKKMNDNNNLLDMLKGSKDDIKSEIPKSIVFHGFYYIKPIHDRLIQLIEALGIEVVFLNWYNNKYCNEDKESVFEIWDVSFDETFGYPSKDKWIYDDHYNVNKLSDVFAGIYSCEDDKRLYNFNECSLIKYDKSIEFINDYKVDEYYYSSESKGINELLKDYYPDKYSKRHFLSYPIGQFIYCIHDMWDEELKDFKLDINTLQELFSSGWLGSEKNGNAIEYTYDLYKIEAYMGYCTSIDDWINRLESLIENNKKAVKENIEYIDRFSFFDVDRDRLKIIRSFVIDIKSIVNTLNSNDVTTINSYFEKLLRIVNDIELKTHIELEENITSNLKEILSKGIDNDIECYTEDIIKALTLVLSGDFEGDKDNIYDDRKEIVKSIKKIESASLLHDEDTCIHICQMSESYMKKGTSFTWPLNKYNVERIIENSKDNTIRLLKRMKIISENSEAINKYLFYCMLKSSSNIKISWIKNYNGEILDEALYIKLLKIYVDKIKDIDNKTNHNFNQSEDYITKKIDIQMSNRANNRLAKIECNLCTKRFSYSYLTNNKSVYNSDFHHHHLFTSLIRYEAYKKKYKTSYVFEMLEDMFPQWNSIEKNQSRKYIGEYIPYRNYNYEEQVNMIGYHHIYKDKDRVKCIYCPHIDYCMYAKYAIDLKY